MAVNLNRPADFIRDSGASESNVFLIPPSAFEKPVPDSHVKPFDRLKQEVKHLQEENEKLRCLQSQAQNQTPGYVGMAHGHYADELIKHQAEEIADLRSELLKVRQSYEQDNCEWERKLRMCEENHEQELNRLLRQARLTEENLEDRVEKLSTELQKTLETCDHQSIEWKEKYETMSLSLKRQLEEAENVKISQQRSSEARMIDLEADNRRQAKELKDQTEIISRLKTYIGEKETSHKAVAVWNVEKETLENRLKVAQAENQKLQSQSELLEIRFKSLNEILTVQEADLSKAKKDGLNKIKQHGIILNRWREKVFALLVQQKSSEISYKNAINKANEHISQLEEEQEVQRAHEEVLQHSLKDKDAQLQMEMHNKIGLQQELEEAKQIAICLDDQSKENDVALGNMKVFIERMHEKYESTFRVFDDKSNHLKVLCQRVSFAASRMDMLKSQMVRKAALVTDTGPSTVINDSKRSLSLSRGDEDISRDSEEHLYQELERVMRERDSLATQVREDSTKWSKRLTETRTQYHTEITTLKKTVEDLEFDIQQKTKKCTQLTEELESLKETDKEKDDTISQLQAELARHARGTESNQRLKDEALYTEKMADLERQLNDSKREHAKTVVSLRQMERSHSRELERSKDLLLTTEQHLNSQLLQLKNQLMSLEKERNTLVATLRQEGLLSKMKSDRAEPVHLALDDHSGDIRKHLEEDVLSRDSKENQKEPKIDSIDTIKITKDEEPKKLRIDNQGPEIVSARGIPEPVENVIKDLKTLTAAIFDDDEDEDDEIDG